jgi:hypothetical protein
VDVVPFEHVDERSISHTTTGLSLYLFIFGLLDLYVRFGSEAVLARGRRHVRLITLTRPSRADD